ncbi:myelin-associated glycoprotein-like isoform X1 [Pungitius pungitius]|uniref:myelin-associated glycoprotein-like isoform X1 n=1 Tax=Pungitius pungitius TaxID=134920 RepID=UPI001887E756|nr:myelin-associated glycoprotein-like isoform X1 [Pungitius pungitius]XP_037309735.1 myelin-associated glycoprotein-like isoform X1 [Pungitius pungitius]XP_037309736.1 myelin-associated glycoprotein-like isoform X1 [Pungitius pungitius]XP_037309737.1 myelin-associated glycoprotein-like isoform X1 [Pungitius pungitius]XP_037309738.1 myelin-associated glycoprotein-like isoform X1 [Pungitius pungitius]XP_037309741.1 myelin-associated glycoprotein-like isoform X1 [Pungitius pungitius]XP_03730974
MIIFCLLLAAFSSPVFTGEWKANVVKELEVLVTSCAVIPCTYTHPKDHTPTSRQRRIWHRGSNKEERIYAEDQTLVLENFKGRTQMFENQNENNCTLEMTGIQGHDNGPFCFRIELVQKGSDTPSTDKFSFVENCVTFKILNDQKPKLTQQQTAIQGKPYVITCSVTHTCPSKMPKLTWNRVTTDDAITVVHKDNRFGYWETESILTFIPGEKDDHSEISCTAEFNGGKTSQTTLMLYVKRTETYNHIIIPTVAVIGTAAIFAVICTVMVKRYRKRIDELQSRDGSLWNRMSRFSHRIRSHASGPSRADPRPANQKVTKGRFPSPKSPPKSCNYRQDADDGDDHMNALDNNVYGNM